MKFTVYLKGNILKHIHGSSSVNKWKTNIWAQNKISSPPCCSPQSLKLLCVEQLKFLRKWYSLFESLFLSWSIYDVWLCCHPVMSDSWWPQIKYCKEIQPVHPKGDQSWVFIGRINAEAETPIFQPPHEKSWLTGRDPDAGGGLGAGGEGGDRGWDGWMATPTRWAWNSGSWWWTGRPGVLWFMGSQTVEHNWVTKLNWTEY